MEISSDVKEKLEIYLKLLRQWQAKINLVSPSTLATAWDRHFIDSLQLTSYINQNASLYDLGTGAGFPGLVLSLCRSDIALSLIESDEKKCAFLQTVSRETGVKVKIITARIEKISSQIPAPDIVTARALAPVDKLLNYSKLWIAQNPALKMLLLKGKAYQIELDSAQQQGWKFDAEIIESQTDLHGAIVALTRITAP